MIRRLGPADLAAARALDSLFVAAFEEPETCSALRPEDGWLREVLGARHIVVLVAERDGVLVGGLVAYFLDKLDRRRTELLVYDLAVATPHRRQGIGTALLRALGPVAGDQGANAVFVQADREDGPAVALYTSLGRPQDVLHFDLDLGAAAPRPVEWE